MCRKKRHNIQDAGCLRKGGYAMKLKKMLCAALLAALLAAMGVSAQAMTLTQAWMEYEDYSDNRAEQSVEGADALKKLEKILDRAMKNPAKLDDCTLNCTLFCMTEDGDIYDFACATDGCPYIQSRDDDKVYTLGVDYQDFWDMFASIRDGMGFEASSVFDW